MSVNKSKLYIGTETSFQKKKGVQVQSVAWTAEMSYKIQGKSLVLRQDI